MPYTPKPQQMVCPLLKLYIAIQENTFKVGLSEEQIANLLIELEALKNRVQTLEGGYPPCF